MSLRNYKQSIIDVLGKKNGVFSSTEGKLIDLSGGSLAQTFLDFPPCPDDIVVTPSSGFDSPAKREYESTLLQHTFKDGGALWANSGSDGMEAALWSLQIARKEYGFEDAVRYWVRRGGYHGNTYINRALSTRNGIQNSPGIEVNILEEHDVNQPYLPASGISSKNVDNDSLLLNAVIKAITDGKLRPGDVLILESLPTTGYVFQYSTALWEELFKICKLNNILSIIDEVAAGAFRHNHFSLVESLPSEYQPDAVVLSKGLLSGAYPLSVVALCKEVTESIRRHSQKPISFTFGLTETAARIGLTVFYHQNSRLSEEAPMRSNLIIDAALRLSESISQKHIGITTTPTTLRLDVPLNDNAKLKGALKSNGMWCYIGQSIFPTSLGNESRSFVHVCPPFDWDIKLFETTLLLFTKTIIKEY